MKGYTNNSVVCVVEDEPDENLGESETEVVVVVTVFLSAGNQSRVSAFQLHALCTPVWQNVENIPTKLLLIYPIHQLLHKRCCKLRPGFKSMASWNFTTGVRVATTTSKAHALTAAL